MCLKLDVAQADRMILDTNDGVAVALMCKPQEAQFASLTIRYTIVDLNQTNKSLKKLPLALI